MPECTDNGTQRSIYRHLREKSAGKSFLSKRYYLPKEDMAVHKSVGCFVEPAYRQKATAANCYIKKDGRFLPLPAGTDWDSPVFSLTRKDKKVFIPWEENTELATDSVCHLINGFMHMPE